MGLLQIVTLIFEVYKIFLILRILSSWFPEWQEHPFVLFLHHYTEPYLAIFRKIVPPLGFLDLSPLVAFFALSIIQSFILHLLSNLRF